MSLYTHLRSTFNGLSLLPYITIVVLYIGFGLCYCIAVYEKHVYLFWPYISDTGAFPPESCWFSFFLNIGGFLISVTGYMRYRQISEYISVSNTEIENRLKFLNAVSAIFIIAGGFGVTLVANFQEVNIEALHYGGAVLCFGLGPPYVLLQAYMSYKLLPVSNSNKLVLFRLILGIIGSTTVITCLLTGILSEEKFDDDVPDPDNQYWQWNKDLPDYGLRTTSTASEWITAGTFILYFLSLMPEFKNLRLSIVSRRNNHFDEDINN